MEYSPLQKARYAYKPKLPLILRDEIGTIEIKRGAKGEPKSDQKELKALFPNTYGMESVSFTKGSTTKKMEKTNVGDRKRVE